MQLAANTTSAPKTSMTLNSCFARDPFFMFFSLFAMVFGFLVSSDYRRVTISTLECSIFFPLSELVLYILSVTIDACRKRDFRLFFIFQNLQIDARGRAQMACHAVFCVNSLSNLRLFSNLLVTELNRRSLHNIRWRVAFVSKNMATVAVGRNRLDPLIVTRKA